MLSDTLALYINASADEIDALLHEAPDSIHQSDQYHDWLDDIDLDKLSNTMVSARHYMDENLPPLVDHYMEKYDMEEFPLTGFMVCNWVVAYVKTPSTLPNLLKTHSGVSQAVMVDTLPEILDMLGNVPEAAEEWQRAFATVVIPLVTLYTAEQLN